MQAAGCLDDTISIILTEGNSPTEDSPSLSQNSIYYYLFKTYHCPGENCKVTKQMKKALVKHISDEHDRYQYKCRMCNKGYLSLIGCYKHEKHHTMGKCYKCDECGKNFQFEGEHYRKHTGDDLWYCEKDKNWDKAYPSKRARNLHHKSHTDSQDYHCDIVLKDGTTCDQVCVSPNHLKKHKRGMHGPGWNSRCGKHFIWPGTMYSHQKECTDCADGKKK